MCVVYVFHIFHVLCSYTGAQNGGSPGMTKIWNRHETTRWTNIGMFISHIFHILLCIFMSYVRAQVFQIYCIFPMTAQYRSTSSSRLVKQSRIHLANKVVCKIDRIGNLRERVIKIEDTLFSSTVHCMEYLEGNTNNGQATQVGILNSNALKGRSVNPLCREFTASRNNSP